MPAKMRFRDRREAGRFLAERLEHYAGRADVIVLGLPRGGVPVAAEIAMRLPAPLDIFIVRKLGVPGYPELAMGAIASGGLRVVNEDVLRYLPEAARTLDAIATRELAEIARREETYREGRPPLELRGRIVILVDDGLATGATMRAAAESLRLREVAKLVVAVPVGSAQTCREFETAADETICALAPADFEAVGQYYEDFSPTTDDEVYELLAAAEK
ncbi:MAG TPA: phosphoribosyltransferase [Chthoniobacterales bacterium]|nr:phosphoribosyltransferase [Chthoniobacterales bacterium]